LFLQLSFCYRAAWPAKKAASLLPSVFFCQLRAAINDRDDLCGHDPGGLCDRDDRACKLRYDGDHVTSRSATHVHLLQ